ncbi:MAG TPA: hypothetical protein VMN37_07710 [Gemmatimonadales bacterium]|nr:hypothetical protein [Gemmatimonadales bacterium]
MKPALIPPTEAARLEALHACQVLDSAPERAFDDLTRLAAQICDTPMATITLVDPTRQWFKSQIGMPARETPRDIAFCAHAILGRRIMVVPDARSTRRSRSRGRPGARVLSRGAWRFRLTLPSRPGPD